MKTINKLVILSVFAAIIVSVPSISGAYYTGLCLPHSYQMCNGNNLYWYDSCGNQQDISQYCQNGCYNNSCQNYNNYNNYSNCTYHAYKLCVGNNIYWYDSCGIQQDLDYSCNNGLVCQYGQCTSYVQPTPIYNNYVPYYRTACSGSSIYWYDSFGVASGLYKKCADNNSCTLDSCYSKDCSNIKKCDGSTCAIGSADYNTYCLNAQPDIITPQPNLNCGNGLCEPTLGETSDNCTNDCKIDTTPNTNQNTTGLSISFFIKQDLNSNQWQKTAQVNSNNQVYFMISATNSSTAQIDNVNISANIPTEISSLGNLKLDGVSISGDIVSGINIGSIAPATTKSITFEGKTQTISEASTKQAVATSNVSGVTQTDSFSININPGQSQETAAAVSDTQATSGFMDFLKRWYLWILVGLVLIFLFGVVYKRLSSNV